MNATIDPRITGELESEGVIRIAVRVVVNRIPISTEFTSWGSTVNAAEAEALDAIRAQGYIVTESKWSNNLLVIEVTR